MDGLPVTVRLLDPPLHEFLPDGEVPDCLLIVHRYTLHTHTLLDPPLHEFLPDGGAGAE
jgi:phosphoenolpyruvate synthase/pyruvate phosphate dikinase